MNTLQNMVQYIQKKLYLGDAFTRTIAKNLHQRTTCYQLQEATALRFTLTCLRCSTKIPCALL